MIEIGHERIEYLDGEYIKYVAPYLVVTQAQSKMLTESRVVVRRLSVLARKEYHATSELRQSIVDNALLFFEANIPRAFDRQVILCAADAVPEGKVAARLRPFWKRIGMTMPDVLRHDVFSATMAVDGKEFELVMVGLSKELLFSALALQHRNSQSLIVFPHDTIVTGDSARELLDTCFSNGSSAHNVLTCRVHLIDVIHERCSRGDIVIATSSGFDDREVTLDILSVPEVLL